MIKQAWNERSDEAEELGDLTLANCIRRGEYLNSFVFIYNDGFYHEQSLGMISSPDTMQGYATGVGLFGQRMILDNQCYDCWVMPGNSPYSLYDLDEKYLGGGRGIGGGDGLGRGTEIL